ncbi:hypothetical protein RHMOL_Rhmol11G0000400 [Rhododendron molle]|uniref:Uncharacterized protein n=1 Tax=Rhododendron molle TaxID=49168 RepID=A0ACC0LMD8_RHOML|nr:hypothetical protein RHMOL_Rhmol11G0000400 [Rhododendron molle]
MSAKVFTFGDASRIDEGKIRRHILMSAKEIFNSVETSVNSDREHSKSLADEEGDYAEASELYSRSLEIRFFVKHFLYSVVSLVTEVQMEGFQIFNPQDWEPSGMDGTSYGAEDLKKCLEGLARHLFVSYLFSFDITGSHNIGFLGIQGPGFNSLEEFNDGKRSCRKRLDGHNRRRRKPQTEPLSRAGSFLSNDEGSGHHLAQNSRSKLLL